MINVGTLPSNDVIKKKSNFSTDVYIAIGTNSVNGRQEVKFFNEQSVIQSVKGSAHC